MPQYWEGVSAANVLVLRWELPAQDGGGAIIKNSSPDIEGRRKSFPASSLPSSFLASPKSFHPSLGTFCRSFSFSFSAASASVCALLLMLAGDFLAPREGGAEVPLPSLGSSFGATGQHFPHSPLSSSYAFSRPSFPALFFSRCPNWGGARAQTTYFPLTLSPKRRGGGIKKLLGSLRPGQARFQQDEKDIPPLHYSLELF